MDWWNRRSKGGKVGIIIAAVIVILIAIPKGDDPPPTQAVAVSPTTTAATVETTAAETTTTAPAETTTTAAPSAPTWGAAIATGDWRVTAAQPEDAPGMSAFQGPGMKTVAVDVTVENTGKEPLDLNVMQFTLTDDQGYTYNNPGVTGKEPQLSVNTIAPGRSVRGYIGFDIPEGNSPASLMFEPELWGSGDLAIWE